MSTDFGPYPAHTQYHGEVVCNVGQHAISGGVLADSNVAGQQAVNSSYPTNGLGDPGSQGWGVDVDNVSSTPLGFTVYAVCAAASSVTGP